jgi:hypothetical protein
MGLNLTSGGYYYEMSDETKLKISKAHTGKILSKEHREKLSKSHIGQKHNIGFKHSKESKERMRLSAIGNKCRFGTICSDKTKLLLSKINSIPVIQMDLNGNFIKEWESGKSTKEYGFIESCVNACCNGTRKTHKKFT